MFQTFTSIQSGDDPFLVEIIRPPIQQDKDSKHHVACIYCREKKLKCTSEPTGCRRCCTKGLECHYPEPLHGNKSRQLKDNSNSKRSDPQHGESSSGKAGKQVVRRSSQSQPEDSSRSSSEPVANRHPAVPDIEPSTSPSATLGSFGVSHVLPWEASGSKFEIESFGDETANGLFDDSNIDYNSDDIFMMPRVNQSMHFDPMSPMNHVPQPPTPLENSDNISLSFIDNIMPMSSDPGRRSRWSPDTNLLERSASPTILGASVTDTRTRTDFHSSQGSSDSSLFDNASCRCSPAMLDVFEKLSISVNSRNHRLFNSPGNSIKSQEGLLSFMKRVLTKCCMVLQCRNCARFSPIVMLMLQICGSMLLHFRTLYQMLLGRVKSQSRQSSSSSQLHADGTMMMDTNDGRSGKVSLFGRSLSLDLEDETSISKALIWSRIETLSAILSRLENTIITNGWQDHADVFKNVNSAFKTLAASLQRLKTLESDGYQ